MSIKPYPKPYSLHVGLAPFLTAQGNKVASYQVLNPEGKAVATVSFQDETAFQCFVIPELVNKADFLAQARILFTQTQAISFSQK